jgi:hypothetical protein
VAGQWRKIGSVGKLRPLDGVEHVLDHQAQFGVADDRQFAVEEQRVRVFLACQQLQESRQVGAEAQVRRLRGALNSGRKRPSR